MILWIPLARLALRHDHQAVQTNDRDQGTRREEVLEDPTAGIRLQPDHPDVVRSNPCIPLANMSAGG
jgi:hypothetical protein